jgi:coenzyme F420-reducing hydrogenase beta subunit
MNSCPVNAITMNQDKEGFRYPKVNASLCLDCDKCKAVCPYYNDFRNPVSFSKKIYAVKHRNEDIRRNSTSGGFFTAISDEVLKKGGIVYGVVLSENLKVCHQRAETVMERDNMRGSKYVQSELGYLYQKIREDLSKQRLVLFTGTPCQNAGLISYLNQIDTEHLILCDIICHGVTCSLMWEEYKSFVKAKKGYHLIKHDFRSKINGWHSMISLNTFRNGKKDSNSCLSQIHMNLFLNNLILRPSCYKCRYSSFSRCSDITMGDFWGIERSMPEFDDNQGISLILINTIKGEKSFNEVRDSLEIIESSEDKCIQRNLYLPTESPKDRESFWADYLTYGYRYVVTKYTGYCVLQELIHAFHTKSAHVGLLMPIKKLRKRMMRRN